MRNQRIEAEIENFLTRKSIPATGVSEIVHLSWVPKDFAPQSVLKGAKSIICYGVPIPKGVIYAHNNDLGLYWRYCNMLYRSLDMASNQLCLILEEQGYWATPVYGCYPWRLVGNEFWGLLSLVYWSEQAGLGKVTKCGLLANPTYGTRMLLGGVVTTSDLEPTEKLHDDVCPSDCIACVEACPVNAIENTGKVDHNLCLRYSSANPLMVHLLKDQKVKEKFSFETILNTVAVDDHGSYSCFDCLKACPLNKR